MNTYKIVRNYNRLPGVVGELLIIKKRTIARGLSLEQVQAHCRNPATSSINAGNAPKRNGWDWFDGYAEEK